MLGDGPVVVVDVLGETFFEHEHLPGAVNVPAASLERDAGTALADRGARVVVYGAHRNDHQPHAAAAVLRRLGYTDVWVYADGKEGWILAGQPTERADVGHS